MTIKQPDKDGFRFIGKPVRRAEDERLVTGKGRFSDDFKLDYQAYAAVVRSPHPHAMIRKIDTTTSCPLALLADDQRVSVVEQDLRIQLFGETTLHRLIGQSCKDQINLAFVKFRKFHRRLVYRHNMKSYTRMVL